MWVVKASWWIDEEVNDAAEMVVNLANPFSWIFEVHVFLYLGFVIDHIIFLCSSARSVCPI